MRGWKSAHCRFANIECFKGESALANKLCSTIGGILSNDNGTAGVLEGGNRTSNGTATTAGNGTKPGVSASPSPSMFLSEASNLMVGGAFGALMTLMVCALGYLVL